MTKTLPDHPRMQEKPPGNQESYPGNEPGNTTRAIENTTICNRGEGFGEGGVICVGGYPSYNSYQGSACRDDQEHACNGGGEAQVGVTRLSFSVSQGVRIGAYTRLRLVF